MATIEERVSRLEGAYEHLATKADVVGLRADMARMESRLLRWMVGTIVTGMATSASIAFLIYRILGD